MKGEHGLATYRLIRKSIIERGGPKDRLAHFFMYFKRIQPRREE